MKPTRRDNNATNLVGDDDDDDYNYGDHLNNNFESILRENSTNDIAIQDNYHNYDKCDATDDHAAHLRLRGCHRIEMSPIERPESTPLLEHQHLRICNNESTTTTTTNHSNINKHESSRVTKEGIVYIRRKSTLISRHHLNLIMLLVISTLALEATNHWIGGIECNPAPGGFLISGHPILCQQGQPVDMGQHIPGWRDLPQQQCYTCSCPMGQIICGRIDDSLDCMPGAGGLAKTLTNRGGGGGVSFQTNSKPHYNNLHQQHQQHHYKPAPHGRPAAETQHAKLPSTKSIFSRQPKAQPQAVSRGAPKPKMGIAKPISESKKPIAISTPVAGHATITTTTTTISTSSSSNNHHNEPHNRPSRHPNLAGLFDAPMYPYDDPIHHRNTAETFGLSQEQLRLKLETKTRQLMPTTTTTPISSVETTTLEPTDDLVEEVEAATTTTTTAAPMTVPTGYPEDEDDVAFGSGDEQTTETTTSITTTDNAQTMTTSFEDNTTITTTAGSIIDTNTLVDPTDSSVPQLPSNEVNSNNLDIQETSRSESKNTTTEINHNNINDMSSNDAIEQVSNDGMFIIAMAVEFTILLLIIILIVIFYIFRDEPQEQDISSQQSRQSLQSRRSPSLDKSSDQRLVFS